MHYKFEWDPYKASINAKKHQVTFDQACHVFDDPMALTIFDEDSSTEDEDRWITLGKSNSQYYLVVVHTFRSHNDQAVTIRVISARKANKREVRQYEQGL